MSPSGRSRSFRSARRFAALLVSGGAVVMLASSAQASPETLKRAMGNIIFAPFDLVLSPVVASHTMYNNLRDIDDTIGVRVVYVIPGVAWNTGVQALSAIVREIAGLVELVPGMGLFFIRADLDPIFAPPERGNALIDTDTPALHLKIGVDYMTVPF